MHFREMSEIPKIREKFPRKFPENFRKIPEKLWVFFDIKAILQSENPSFD